MLPAKELRVGAEIYSIEGIRLTIVGRVEVPQEAFVAALFTTGPTKR